MPHGFEPGTLAKYTHSGVTTTVEILDYDDEEYMQKFGHTSESLQKNPWVPVKYVNNGYINGLYPSVLNKIFKNPCANCETGYGTDEDFLCPDCRLTAN